jgi:hypothetical protein
LQKPSRRQKKKQQSRTMGFFDLFSNDSSAEKKSEAKSNLPIKKDSDSIVESSLIPEPTRSLLWVTDEDTSKIEHAGSITLSISVSDKGVHLNEKQNGFYAEPSLIWTKLPIKTNNELIQEAMYWPSYSAFSPEARYQYLRWLGDITQPTNLSYVFLYFYGLERHLLVGEYDAAVDEIARLLKAHPEKSFVQYASQSLIIASLGKDRLDVIDRIPSLLEEEIDEALALRVVKGTSMTPDDVISIASKVGFNNKRYIKLYPELFKEELQKNIDTFEKQFGNLLSTFKLEDFRREDTTVFANLSIPEHVRHIKVPIILEDKKFSQGMNNLLQAAHEGVKSRISSGDIKRRSQPTASKPEQLVSTSPVTYEEINALIDSLRAANDNILDLHFAIQERITEHYRKRQEGDNYHNAIVSCRAQIKIQDEQFIREYPNQALPAHTGYNQLVIILEKEKKIQEALQLAEEAKANGWNGDWAKRIEKLQGKL